VRRSGNSQRPVTVGLSEQQVEGTLQQAECSIDLIEAFLYIDS
jgi:hypothetical protein